jgi:hypothetical protein
LKLRNESYALKWEQEGEICLTGVRSGFICLRTESNDPVKKDYDPSDTTEAGEFLD